ncbi:hypothetical protein MMC18_001454 [Xylographa bjoerkii]|nr:hypothetical protein [Xylographa bjoerkii]
MAGAKDSPDRDIPGACVDAFDSDAAQTFPLLRLPTEIRDTILGELFFPGEKEPDEFEQDTLGLAATAVRQIFPYDRDAHRKPKFDVSILRVCRQLQGEGEAILYGTASWNLMYQDWSDHIKLSYEFFEKFPKRLRRLVRRVERKCYSEPYSETISLQDWQIFMTFLARECPNLHSLRLWAPGDTHEGPPWVDTCLRDKEWVKAILQITTLKEFDIPVIHGGVIYDFPEFKNDFLPWLKSSLLQQPQHNVPLQKHDVMENNEGIKVRFLEFPRNIRYMVYRQVLLPPGRRIHPYIRSWYDQDTKNAVSLFLVNKQINREAELVLYSEGIFTAASLKYQIKFLKMLRGKTYYGVKNVPDYKGVRFTQRLMKLIRHVRVGVELDRSQFAVLLNTSDFVEGPLISFAARFMQLSSLTVVLSDSLVVYMNRQWTAYAPNEIPKWRGGFGNFLLRDIARLPVQVETSDGITLDPSCLEWFTEGLRRERLFRIDISPSMDWLYTRGEDPKNIYHVYEWPPYA